MSPNAGHERKSRANRFAGRRHDQEAFFPGEKKALGAGAQDDNPRQPGLRQVGKVLGLRQEVQLVGAMVEEGYGRTPHPGGRNVGMGGWRGGLPAH